MSESNLNKKYFTEQDSPIPLIPTDLAWENMQEKLNSEQPDKRKRRFFFWIPPVGCATFVLLLLAGGMGMWRQYNKQHKTPLQEQPALSATDQFADTLLTQKELTVNNNHTYNNNDKTKKTALTRGTQLPSANTQTPVGSSDQTFTEQRKLTAYYGAGAMQTPPTVKRKYAYKKKTKTAIVPVEDNNAETDYIGSLPFATPQLTAIKGMAISVTTDRNLPGVAFQEKPSPDSNRNNPFTVSAGLEWQAPIAFTGMDHYFKGENGNNQPYLLLIPGIWVSVAKNRHQLIAKMLPYTSALLPDKYYEKGLARVSDSLIAYKRMVKTFGLQAGLQYNYQINAHWCIGAGINTNWWNKGLVLAKPVNDSMGIKPFVYTTDPKSEKKLNRFQVSSVFETGYRLHAWEGFVQLSRPWNTTIKDLPPPVWLRLGVKYRLIQRNIGR
ncbi:MAG TPA: hypothetical protein VF008_27545 [Niastella sp.]